MFGKRKRTSVHRPNMPKVLIIFSWDDDISERRNHFMKADSRLTPYRFEQAFALASPQEPVTASAIVDRISAAIDSVAPDVLLLHTGAAFHRSPEQFVICALELARRYPGLRLGYERRPTATAFDELAVFEQSSEMVGIERLFFH